MNQLELLRAANIARQGEWCPDPIPDSGRLLDGVEHNGMPRAA